MASQSMEVGHSPSAGMAIRAAKTDARAIKAAALDAPNSMIDRP
jgi:hypothetical protein